MYRDELDALNAIVIEQRRTNELLERLLETSHQESKSTVFDAENKTEQKRNYQRRSAK